jgi:FkbM family methyltransferase
MKILRNVFFKTVSRFGIGNILKKELRRYGYALTDATSFLKVYEFVDLAKKSGIELNTIYDIGANKGSWTREINAHFPSKFDFILCEANIAHKPDLEKTGFHFYNVLLSDQHVKTEFFSVDGTGDSIFREMTDRYKEVKPVVLETSTLDSLIKEHELPYPDLIKLDTQGSELFILKGSIDAIKSVKFIVIECSIVPYNSGAPSFSELVDFLKAKNFQPYAITEFHKDNKRLFQIDIIFVSDSIIQLLP